MTISIFACTLPSTLSMGSTKNPSWESIQFTTTEFGKHSSISGFVIKLWVRPLNPTPSPPAPLLNASGNPHPSRSGLKGKDSLAFEKTIDLSDLVYLGTLVNKDGSSYPPNSVVIGMFEGYYSDAGVGGVLSIPHISHSLVDLLPQCSLLEVPRGEVFDSYFSHTLIRTLSRQEVLDKATVQANNSKGKVQSYLKEQEEYFRKKRERESLKMKIGLLQRQVLQQERLEKEESEQLMKQKESLNSMEFTLRDHQANLQQLMAQYQVDYHSHHQNMDLLARTLKSKTLRQRNMIYELSQTFIIKEVGDVFTICNVILPNADQLDHVSNSNLDQFGVALGYAAHLVNNLSNILLVPLQYPIKPNGSRSSISDHISDEIIIDTIKEFPLYLRGSEKALFLYAIHLFNRDIGQMRQHCGYGGSRSMLKKTLPNLKFLLDELIKDFFVSKPLQKMPPTRYTSQPIDASSPLENGSLRRFERMSTISSQCSSAATATTTGLSLTPPTPSPVTTMNHENFHHSVAVVVNSSRTPPVEEGSGGEGISSSPTRHIENENEKSDGFSIGMFRSRSNHVTGNYSATELPPGSPGNSSHEQLHYGASIEEPQSNEDEVDNLPSSLRLQQESLSSLEERKLEHRMDDDIGGFSDPEILQYPIEPLIITSEARSTEEEVDDDDSSPTPTPSRDPQLERYSNAPILQINEDGGDTLNNRDAGREGSPAVGGGLFAPQLPGNEAVYPDGILYRQMPGSSESNIQGGALNYVYGGEGGGVNNSINTDLSLASVHANRCEDGVLLQQEEITLHHLDIESNLDFPNRRRSSKLVDPSDIQARRDKVQTREHNLPPETLQNDDDVYPKPVPLHPDSMFFTTSEISTTTSSVDYHHRSSGRVVARQPFLPHNDGDGGIEEEVKVTGAKPLDFSNLSRDMPPPPPPPSISVSPGNEDGSSTRSAASPSRISTDSQRVVELAGTTSLPSGGTSVQKEPNLQIESCPRDSFPPLSVPDDKVPSPSTSPLVSSVLSSSPQVSFSSMLRHTPTMYRTVMATPHVLGPTLEPYHHRERAHSNKIENRTGLQLRTGSDNLSHSRSQSSEGDTQFLEDFIDVGL